MDSNEIADVIERAADILESERKQWCQGMYYRAEDGGGHINAGIHSVCALGALRLAIVNEEVGRLLGLWPVGSAREEHQKERLAIAAFRDHLIRQGYELDDMGGIDDYNDAPERTKEQVIEVMKATAKDLRNANHTVL